MCPAQGAEGECNTASQLSALSASVEKLIAVMRTHMVLPMVSNEARVWSIDSLLVSQPVCDMPKECSDGMAKNRDELVVRL